MYTNMYVRTATLDPVKKVGFLQPLQGRYSPNKIHVVRSTKIVPCEIGCLSTYPLAWQEADEHFQVILL